MRSQNQNNPVSVPLRGLSQWKVERSKPRRIKDECFSPLTGIKSVESSGEGDRYSLSISCFSPLTGIKSVESIKAYPARVESTRMFQSPYGD